MQAQMHKLLDPEALSRHEGPVASVRECHQPG
jgi:hypothetical protein